jgi:hypothetical protein
MIYCGGERGYRRLRLRPDSAEHVLGTYPHFFISAVQYLEQCWNRGATDPTAIHLSRDHKETSPYQRDVDILA